MPIAVVCPGCKSQFRVSDQFAGKTGACPKCKAKITVPSLPEVKVHGPDEFAAGGKDSAGRAVVKPLPRIENKLSTLVQVGLIGGVITTMAVAWVAGRIVSNKPLLCVVGLALVSFPLVWGGYLMFRTEEVEPYRGKTLILRSLICALLYSLLWGLFALVPDYWVEEYWSWFYIAPPFLVAGAVAGLASLDLEFSNGFFHYCLFLTGTIVLRYLIGMPLFVTGGS